MGHGTNGVFSFVHRRFNEYFVARRLNEEFSGVDFDDIASDSRWRDALVFYTEVSDDTMARNIANYCWSEISNAGNVDVSSEEYLRAVHCLRFLRDAFRSRRDCLSDFSDKLEAFIQSEVQSKNLLRAKLAVEVTGVLDDHQIGPIILDALAIKDSWVSETALRACRNLPKIEKPLQTSLRSLIGTLGFLSFLRRSNELTFSFSLSDAFRPLHKYCRIRMWDHRVLLCSLPLVIGAAPIMMLLVSIISGWSLLQWKFMEMLSIRERLDKLFGRKRRVSAEKTTPEPNEVPLNDGVLENETNAAPVYATATWASHNDLRMLRLVVSLLLVGSLIGIEITGERTSNERPLDAFDSETLQAGYNSLGHMMIAPYAPTYVPGFRETDAASRCGAAIIVVLSLIVFPFYCISEAAPSWGKVFIAVGLSGGALAVVFLLNLIEEYLGDLILVILTAVMVAVMLFLVGMGLIDFVKDYFLLVRSRREFSPERATIERQFGSFRTPSGRLRYVRWLDSQKVTPRGKWVRELPSSDTGRVGDLASRRLAQLEERWLGLD